MELLRLARALLGTVSKFFWVTLSVVWVIYFSILLGPATGFGVAVSVAIGLNISADVAVFVKAPSILMLG